MRFRPQPPPPLAPGSPWVKSAALAAVIVAALLVCNAPYFFRAQLYEQGDFAADSLTVLQAKKFQALYGAYSRWGFHHPGPAFFYCYAAGEALFYDWLKLVPTPFNAQAIVGLILAAGFFAAALGTASCWVGSRWFAPLTLLLAVAHFGALASPILGSYALLLIWPACVVIMPFLCLLVTAASVGAGRGNDLPLLALACGFLVHSHVAQPLFTLPLFALAYGGLAWSAQGRPPWREFPRAHALTVGIVALFVLPVAIDLCRGSHSNFALVLEHLRTHRGERHPWLDALSYFLDFSAYRPYRSDHYEAPPGATLGRVGLLLAKHPETTLLWAAALAVFLGGWLRHRRPVVQAGSDESAAAVRWRYLRWLGACLALCVVLTLIWAHIQDGKLFFFNALFNYAIYFGLAMLAAGVVAGALDRRVRTPAGQRWGVVALYGLAAGLFLLRPERFREHYFDTAQARGFATTVRTAVRDDGAAPGAARYLWFTPNAWDQALTVALLLERGGGVFRVRSDQAYLFGAARAVESPAAVLLASASPAGWRVNPRTTGPGSRQMPLDDRYGLDWWVPTVDPGAGAALFSDGAHHPAERTAEYDEKADASACVCDGLTPPDAAAPYSLNDHTEAVLCFRAAPVAGGATVELAIDLFPLCFPGVRDRRRLQVLFNGQLLDDWTLDRDAPVRVRIPAALWNARPQAAVLQWRFPDAVSARALGVSRDIRPLAFGFRKLEFSLGK